MGYPGLQMILCVMMNHKTDLYDRIKEVAGDEIVTQCVLGKNINNAHKTFCNSMVRKIDAKFRTHAALIKQSLKNATVSSPLDPKLSWNSKESDTSHAQEKENLIEE